MTTAAVQRLEAWMKEVTDLLLYQPDIPFAHKQCVAEAMVAFTKEIEAAPPLNRKEVRSETAT